MKPWKRIVGAIAPTVATALGGPFAGTAVAAIGKRVLGDEYVEGDQGENEKRIAALIESGDPEVLARVKESENDLKAELKRLDIEELEVHAADRKDARSLARGMIAQGRELWPQLSISLIYVVGFFGILAALVTGYANIPAGEGSREVVLLLTGALAAGVESVRQFWLGSSVGSKNKEGRK